MRLVLNTPYVIEGGAGEITSVEICLELIDILDGLQRDLYFNLSIVNICKLLLCHNTILCTL